MLLTLEPDGAAPRTRVRRAGSRRRAGDGRPAGTDASVQREPAPPPPPPSNGAGGDHDAQVVVIGSGPGRLHGRVPRRRPRAEDVLIERYDTLGGVCLNVGCIPSKALLHAARVVAEAEEMAEHGIKFGKPKVDLDELRAWKASVVGKLTGGLAGLAKQRKVEVVTGVASLTGPNTRRGRRPDGHVRQLHHRRRLRGGVDARRSPKTRGSSTRPARSSCRRSPSGCS